jgi:rhomboid protease GluP
VPAPLILAAGVLGSGADGAALLRGGLSEAEAYRIVVLLASMGIEARVGTTMQHDAGVYVPYENLDAARRVLADEPASTFAERDKEPLDVGLVAPRAWFGRGAVAVLGVMIVCAAVFVAALRDEDAGTRTSLLAFGAIDGARVRAGEYWRLLTAIFLHFDIGHLLANLGVLAIVGPPLAHQIGAVQFLLVFLVSGVGGNVASQLFMPTIALKAGASGAITGVLGALGGLSLRPERRVRRKAWQTLGALAAIYGFLVGFAATSDNVAHVGGLVTGLALGQVLKSAAPAGRSAVETGSGI